MNKNVYNSYFIPSTVHSDWDIFLNDDILSLLSKIEHSLNTDIAEKRVTPPNYLVLRFLTMPLYSAKAVIIGQDPYPQEGIATGRAFEVGSLVSWGEPFRNVSLRNIVRALYFADRGEYLVFNDIKKEIIRGWQLLMPNEIFKSWEKQGVLLLNTSFTCRIGNPGSHALLWREFTQRLLCFINEANPQLFWLLWGNHAHKVTEHLVLNNVIRTMHPMMCVKKNNRPSDFLYGRINCFKETSHIVRWRGI